MPVQVSRLIARLSMSLFLLFAPARAHALEPESFQKCFYWYFDHYVDNETAIEHCSRILDHLLNFNSSAETVHNEYMKQWDRAAKYFKLDLEKAISPPGFFVEAVFYQIGQEYSELEQYDDAIEYFDLTIKHNKKFIVAYIERGKALSKLRNYRAAIADFDSAIRHYSAEGDESSPKAIEAYLGRASAHNGLGNYQDALKDTNHVLSRDRKNADAYFSRALVYRKTGKLAQAIEDLTRAIEIEPKITAFYIMRMEAYLQAGEKEKAELDKRQIDRIEAAEQRELEELIGKR